MISVILSILLININISYGAIQDCNNRFEHKHPESAEDAVWCSDEGGSCSGPGRVYYGAATMWTYKDLKWGESISCNNGAFDCDPLFAFTKKCYITRPTEYVEVDFGTLSILKTVGDGGEFEEWDIVDSNPTITMNVDFINLFGSFDQCVFNIEHHELTEYNGGECNPPDDLDASSIIDGHNCYIGGAGMNNPLQQQPKIFVSKDVYNAGLKYTFNFQVGDHDGEDNGIFDNGPIFSFSYTEPDHRAVNALRSGSIYRYFTRTGAEGRIARLYVRYSLYSGDENPILPTNCN